MKTLQLFPGGSLSFSTGGNSAGTSSYREQHNGYAKVLKRDGEKSSFEEMLWRELGARPVTTTGLSNNQTRSVDTVAATMDSRAAQSLWDFWA